MTITEAINLLKQYYKAHNREDAEIEGEIRVVGGEVVVNAKRDKPNKPAELKIEKTGEAFFDGHAFRDDPKLGRGKTGDGK